MKAALAEHQRTDDQQIGEVEDNAGGEGRRVKARVIIDRAGKPAARRHARAAAELQGRYSPGRFAGRVKLAECQHIRRNDPAETQTERCGNGER